MQHELRILRDPSPNPNPNPNPGPRPNQVSQQLSKNIIFCEQQTMLQRNEKVGDVSKERVGEVSISQGILLLDADGTYGSGSPGGLSSKLYYTEMHIDVFRIVHEQVEACNPM